MNISITGCYRPASNFIYYYIFIWCKPSLFCIYIELGIIVCLYRWALVFAYTCLCVKERTKLFVWVCICVCVCKCMREWVCIIEHLYSLRACVCVCVRACVWMQVYLVREYVHMCVCMHALSACVHAYAHTICYFRACMRAYLRACIFDCCMSDIYNSLC